MSQIQNRILFVAELFAPDGETGGRWQVRAAFYYEHDALAFAHSTWGLARAVRLADGSWRLPCNWFLRIRETGVTILGDTSVQQEGGAS